jgi:hypothetical protein
MCDSPFNDPSRRRQKFSASLTFPMIIWRCSVHVIKHQTLDEHKLCALLFRESQLGASSLDLGTQDPSGIRRQSLAITEGFSKTSDALDVISCEVQKLDRRTKLYLVEE